MARGTRITLLVFVAIVSALVAKATYGFVRFSNVERQFSTIQTGDSRASVITKLGKPNYHSGGCGVIHTPLKNCAIEYVYSHPFAPLIPEYYIVSFSSDEHVIEADKWDSP